MKSKVNEGSCFSLILPIDNSNLLLKSETAQERLMTSFAAEYKDESQKSHTLSKYVFSWSNRKRNPITRKKYLIVDDLPFNILVLKELIVSRFPHCLIS